MPSQPHPQLHLGFAHRGDRTILARRLFSWPFVLTRTFALDRAPAHMLTVILQTGSGAVHGDDHLIQRLEVAAGAAAHVTTQGAAAIHRADPGQMACDHVEIGIADGGYLDYLPEPRILFPGAALDQRTEITCARHGAGLVSDAFTLHDPQGAGGRFRRLTSTLILRRGGADPVLVDRLDIGDLGGRRTAGFRAFGSVLVLAPHGAQGLEALAETWGAYLATRSGLYGAASLLPDGACGIGVRLAGRELRDIREGIGAIWALARTRLHGEAPPPRRKGEEPMMIANPRSIFYAPACS